MRVLLSPGSLAPTPMAADPRPRAAFGVGLTSQRVTDTGLLPRLQVKFTDGGGSKRSKGGQGGQGSKGSRRKCAGPSRQSRKMSRQMPQNGCRPLRSILGKRCVLFGSRKIPLLTHCDFNRILEKWESWEEVVKDRPAICIPGPGEPSQASEERSLGPFSRCCKSAGGFRMLVMQSGSASLPKIL